MLAQGFDFRVLGALLMIAALVAIVSQRLRLPYSAGLVVAGGALSLAAQGFTPPLTRDLIFLGFLPPLVFEAAIQIPWRRLRRELPLLAALVTLGMALGVAVVAGGMHWLVGWSWLGAGLFGVLIAATDPVSVIAAFKQLHVAPRLHLLVEAESLLNDGVAAVGFAILAGVAAGGVATPAGVALNLVATVLGGIGCGVAVTVPLVLLAGRTQDRLVEIALSAIIAYGSFLLAEALGCSGVLATLTAGLVVGNWGFSYAISDNGHEGVRGFWEVAAFAINSMIFLLIGGQGVTVPLGLVVEAAAVAVALSLLGRAATVYPVAFAFARTRLRVEWRYKHVLFWGGLRGALALALALALPVQVAERRTIVAVAFAVVAFSILVQGLTMPWLVGSLGLRRGNGRAAGQGTSTVSTATGSVSG
ncbi:cation:proton antiporter [Sphingomonas sp.]|uniref:cation:proton antiporter n=1 Tax=Sphingomonas sp. TaxID=28214 RepID=UPI003CC6CD8A